MGDMRHAAWVVWLLKGFDLHRSRHHAGVTCALVHPDTCNTKHTHTYICWNMANLMQQVPNHWNI